MTHFPNGQRGDTMPGEISILWAFGLTVAAIGTLLAYAWLVEKAG
jgi:hypothetical protein